MSTVKVVARIRPLLKSENEIDKIVEASSSNSSALEQQRYDTIKIPNPKNAGEKFGFQFQAVYDEDGTQQEIFEKEG